MAGASGPRGSFVPEEGRVGAGYPGCWDCGGAVRMEEAAYAALWPLAPGKQVAFLRTAPDGQQARVLIRVVGRETVGTPAGTFDAWLLAPARRSGGRGRRLVAPVDRLRRRRHLLRQHPGGHAMPEGWLGRALDWFEGLPRRDCLAADEVVAGGNAAAGC